VKKILVYSLKFLVRFVISLFGAFISAALFVMVVIMLSVFTGYTTPIDFPILIFVAEIIFLVWVMCAFLAVLIEAPPWHIHIAKVDTVFKLGLQAPFALIKWTLGRLFDWYEKGEI